MKDSVVSAVSYQQDPEAAAAELAQQLNRPDIGYVLFFCAASYPLSALGRALQVEFGDMPMAGCTSGGEITAQGYRAHSLTAIGFRRDGFHIDGGLLDGLAAVDLDMAQQQIAELTRRGEGKRVAPLSGHSFVITLVDGLSVLEEQVLAALNASLGSLPQVGASAADYGCEARETWVYFDGEFRADAAVVLLVNTCFDFKVFSCHHLLPATEKLVVTQACEDMRCVTELNGYPAALEYARITGLELDQLNIETLALNPIAVKLGDQYYVRAVKQCNPDLSLTFYSAIEAGVVLTRMIRSDMRQHLLQTLQEVEQEIGAAQLVLGFDCLARRLETQVLALEEDMSSVLRRFRVIGFNTYGEHYSGMVFNQTFTGVAIGQISHE